MTDITELAQREKFEAWARSQQLSIAYGDCGYVYSSTEIAWRAVKALSAELVEALEKAQQYSKERDAENQNLMLTVGRLRIEREELESRAVKMPKPHAHLIWIQEGHAPDDYWDDVAVSHSEKDRCCDGSDRYPVYARWEIEEMLTAAGIKVEAE
ncbi:TPA: hypothetical protein ACTY4K_002352 [Klebsiella michiganensis]